MDLEEIAYAVEEVVYGDQRLTKQFWFKVEEDEDTGCWLWVGKLSPAKWPVHAHKSAWRLLYKKVVGADPPMVRGMVCDSSEKECIRPNHRLYVDVSKREHAGVWSREEIALAGQQTEQQAGEQREARITRLQEEHAARYREAEDDEDPETETKPKKRPFGEAIREFREQHPPTEDLDHLVPFDYEPPDDGQALPFNVG